MNIRPVGAELFHADGRTDMTKLIVAFRNFLNGPKMILDLSYYNSTTLVFMVRLVEIRLG